MFFFNDTATTEIYTLSLHDALPISSGCARSICPFASRASRMERRATATRSGSCSPRSSRYPSSSSRRGRARSEEHTSELQSRQYLVCRLLLEKKNQPHLA